MIPEETPIEQRDRPWAAQAVRAILRGTLLISPRPTALLVRRIFARTGAETAAQLEHGAPDVPVHMNVRYGEHPDESMDVYRGSSGTSPTVVWIHGGAFVGGAKEELSGYLKRLAGNGFAAVAPSYTLAPEAHHPTQLRQIMRALAHLDEHGDELGVDTHTLFLAGDSAGAMLAAQLALIATRPAYANLTGFTAQSGADRIKGVILCCGPYSLEGFAGASTSGKNFLNAVLWAYSGERRYTEDEQFVAAMSVTNNISGTFPPAFITVGNADPLAPQSAALADALRRNDVEVETLFFPADHEPPLGHEYQFNLDLPEAQEALDQMIGFLKQRSSETT